MSGLIYPGGISSDEIETVEQIAAFLAAHNDKSWRNVDEIGIKIARLHRQDIKAQMVTDDLLDLSQIRRRRTVPL